MPWAGRAPAVQECRTLLGGVGQEHPNPWQLTVSPAVPVYWRATPTLFSPFLREPVSSTMSTPLASSARCSTTYSRRRSSRTSSASHLAQFSSRCTPCGSCSPMASAICQPFLRSTLPRAARGGSGERAPWPPSGRSGGLCADAVLRTPSTNGRWRTTRRSRLARPCRSLPRSSGRVAQLRAK